MTKPISPRVLFVIASNEADGEYLTAVFPTIPGTADPMTMCAYDPRSGHTSAHENWLDTARPADLTSPEVRALKSDLYLRYDALDIGHYKGPQQRRRWYYMRAAQLGHMTP